jgi:hypothetical protein
VDEVMYAKFFLAALLVLAGCSSAPSNSGEALPEDADELERLAYQRTGDVRVYYYVKPAIVDSAHYKGTTTEQKRQIHVLANHSHSFYRTRDQQLPEGGAFLFNADMHDLLVVLRDQFDFFKRGNAVNILGDDPVARADADPNVSRMIAVEQIIDGKVNTSYFARRTREDVLDEDRARVFNKCQELLLVEVIPKAVPRGSAEHGAPKDPFGKR